jgi:signal transduction histidine kinase
MSGSATINTSPMPGARSSRRPTFLWQAVLIVLPVLLLAIFGLLALRRDYALTEHEARQRAAGIARDLSGQLGRLIAWELAEFTMVGNVWEGAGVVGGQVPWPSQPRLSPEELHRYDQRLTGWQAQHPGLTPADALPVQASLTEAGALSSPPDYPDPPGPPQWLMQLTAEQQVLWDTAKSAESARAPEDQVRAAFDAFLASDPPAQAQTNARFALLLLELKPSPPPKRTRPTPPLDDPQAGASAGGTNRSPPSTNLVAHRVSETPRFTKEFVQLMQQRYGIRIRGSSAQRELEESVYRLLEFGQRADWIPSESGLPLASVALARALREAQATWLNASLFRELSRQTYSVPSVALPQLLALTERLAVDEVSWARPAVRALQDRWASQERLRALARQVQKTLHPTSLLTTNLWLDWGDYRWLAILQPGGVFTPEPDGGQTVARSETRIAFFPKSAVQRAAAQALDKATVSIPPYLQLSLNLEGEGLLAGGKVNGLPPGPGPRDTSSPLFASGTGRLPLPGQAVNPPSGQTSAELLETLPGHPRFTLELRLDDPRRLYAQARQRALLFGGVIVAAAATSLVGLVMARRAFARQLHLSEMKTNFVSSVSHELRAPIASVRLLAESLDRGKVTGATRQAEYFRLIVQECRRLSGLIENVLDFSRIDQGRKQYEFEPTDLVALVQQTVKLMEPYAAARQVQLDVQLGDSPLAPRPSSLDVDGRAVQQALVNLLDNAIKHAPAGTTVTVGLDGMRNAECGIRNAESGTGGTGTVPESEIDVSVCRRPATEASPGLTMSHPIAVRLWVEDHGDGIPPGEQAKIFEPFYRLGSELRRETQGVGIGLTIVQHIVEAHGGRVIVRSAVGQGSRFTIELPGVPAEVQVRDEGGA